MENKQIEEMRPQEIKELVDLLVDYGRTYDDSLRGCEDIVAEIIVTNGYRKASEVAREIFEEIEEGIKAAVSALQFENNPIHRTVKHETYSSLMRFIKTIEKKYEEGER